MGEPFTEENQRSEAVKLDRYNFSGHGDVYFVGIYQLFAGLFVKHAHTGKDELTVVRIHE